ncbi:hypothetical protein PEBR_29549 [Penicillium brasilianum]|uniref:Uncharacterized protein n=1 Tax=Penicillium brasilianum TaxID=104259 RepID=A0A1S9RGM1_PENBI|nr:hypothetical protein PEBR_29549 [Penicillium brasilianum]
MTGHVAHDGQAAGAAGGAPGGDGRQPWKKQDRSEESKAHRKEKNRAKRKADRRLAAEVRAQRAQEQAQDQRQVQRQVQPQSGLQVLTQVLSTDEHARHLLGIGFAMGMAATHATSLPQAPQRGRAAARGRYYPRGNPRGSRACGQRDSRMPQESVGASGSTQQGNAMADNQPQGPSQAGPSQQRA